MPFFSLPRTESSSTAETITDTELVLQINNEQNGINEQGKVPVLLYITLRQSWLV